MRLQRFPRPRSLAAVLLVLAPVLLGACASGKGNRSWQAGDAIICPECGREFTVPEKLGK